MGWGQWLLSDDTRQQQHLTDTVTELRVLSQRLNRASLDQASFTDDLGRLRTENNELKLYTAAIFRLLLEKEIVKVDELETVVDAIDCRERTPVYRRRQTALA